MSEERKVRLYIWAGFLSVVLMLAIIGGVSYRSFGATLVRYQAAEVTNKATINVLLAFRDLTSLRRYGAVHLNTGNENALKRVKELNAEFQGEVNEAIQLSHSAERRQMIERLRDLGTSLNARFMQAAELRAKKVALLAETDAVGHKSRIALDAYGKANGAEKAIAEPMETLMRARLDLARFAGHSSPELNKKVLDLSLAYIKEVKEIPAGQGGDSRAKLAELATLSSTFHTNFLGASAVSLEMTALTDEVMEALGREISSLGQRILKMQSEHQEEVSEKVEHAISSDKTFVGIITLIAMVIGIVSAVVVSRMVAKPIAAMATAARVAEEIGELIKLAADHGDFRNRTPTEGRTGFVATISVAVNRLFDSICLALDSIGRDAGKVALAASAASSAVVEVNAGAAEQARSLEQVRDAIRMSAEAITKVSGTATAASATAAHAASLVDHGQKTIAEIGNLMDAIVRTSRETAQIAQTLGHTVSKTDILVTTVAAEAFKLGGQEGNFEAICQQASSLASETRGYAVKICELVDQTNRDIQAGSLVAGQAREVISNIHHQVMETDGMIRSIAETMLSQHSAIVEIDATTNSLAEIGEHNVEAGEQISMSLVELRDLSGATKASIAEFKIQE